MSKTGSKEKTSKSELRKNNYFTTFVKYRFTKENLFCIEETI